MHFVSFFFFLSLQKCEPIYLVHVDDNYRLSFPLNWSPENFTKLLLISVFGFYKITKLLDWAKDQKRESVRSRFDFFWLRVWWCVWYDEITEWYSHGLASYQVYISCVCVCVSRSAFEILSQGATKRTNTESKCKFTIAATIYIIWRCQLKCFHLNCTRAKMKNSVWFWQCSVSHFFASICAAKWFGWNPFVFFSFRCTQTYDFV